MVSKDFSDFVKNSAWKVSVFGVILELFSRIRTEYGKILRNSKYGHFLRSEGHSEVVNLLLIF